MPQNMPHVRFTNTLAALRECQDHMSDSPEDFSHEEYEARGALIDLCDEISNDYGDNFR